MTGRDSVDQPRSLRTGFSLEARRLEEGRSPAHGPGTLMPEQDDADPLKGIIQDFGHQSPGQFDSFAKRVYSVVNRSFLDPQKEHFLEELATAISGLKWDGSDGIGVDSAACGGVDFKTRMATIIADAMVEYVFNPPWQGGMADEHQAGQSEQKAVTMEAANPEVSQALNILLALKQLQRESTGEPGCTQNFTCISN